MIKYYTLKKNEKLYKEKIYAQHKDIRQLQKDLSVKCCHHLDAKKRIVELTAELEAFKLEITKLTYKFDNASSTSRSSLMFQVRWLRT